MARMGGLPADGRAAEAVVDKPADGEASHRDADCVQRLDVQHRGIDHPGAGVEVELDDQQQEAGEPGQVGFPLEPDQVAGQLLRRHGELLDVVEAAAVDLPRGALHALLHLLALLQRDVEGDEIERGADPADAGDHVRPADQEVEPVEGEGGQARVSSTQRQRAHRACVAAGTVRRPVTVTDYSGNVSSTPWTYQLMPASVPSSMTSPSATASVPSCL